MRLTSLRDLPQAIEVVRRMRAAHGVFLCEGNHDLIENGPEYLERVKRAGIRLLVNEAATLRVRGADLQLLGLAPAEIVQLTLRSG